MKILYLNNQLYLHGGIEKILSQKINHLIDEFNYDVILCTSEHKNNEFIYPLNEKVRHIDLRIDYERSKSYFHPLNLIKVFKHFRALKKVIKSEQPDIIISVNKTPEEFFIPFIEKHIPKVKEFHSSGSNFGTSKSIFGKLKRQLFNVFARYDSLVVLNQDEKKYYPFKNVKVIPNFINIESNTKISEKENTIIAAGRIAPVKQFDHLILAWSQIANKFPNWQVKIFGDGDAELMDKLNILILELNIPNIAMMGQTSNLKRDMDKASVFAMTSATECFPMVLLEAQNAQMALISYDCPYGPRNIIKDKVTGILTPHNSIDDFAKSLQNLLVDERQIENLGVQAQLHVTKFSEQKVMRKWQKLFNDLSN